MSYPLISIPIPNFFIFTPPSKIASSHPLDANPYSFGRLFPRRLFVWPKKNRRSSLRQFLLANLMLRRQLCRQGRKVAGKLLAVLHVASSQLFLPPRRQLGIGGLLSTGASLSQPQRHATGDAALSHQLGGNKLTEPATDKPLVDGQAIGSFLRGAVRMCCNIRENRCRANGHAGHG